MASRPPEDDARARNRWVAIQVMRLGGVIMILLGILLTQGALDLAGDANDTVGYVLLAVGLVEAFVMPVVLARKWSSRER